MSSADIAVVGMSCRLPYIKDPSQLWATLVNGGGLSISITPFPTSYGSEYLLTLQTVAAALRDASRGTERRGDQRIDLIIVHGNPPLEKSPAYTPYGGTTLTICPFVSAISHSLKLKGNSYTLAGGGITSLSALAQAVLLLRQNLCDCVVVGGVHLVNETAAAGGVVETTSRTGTLPAPDKCSAEISLSEGAGALVLKRRAEAIAQKNPIYCFIKGAGSASRSSPSSSLSEIPLRALTQAYHDAGVTPDTIGFIEVNRTNPSAPDSYEYEALKVFFTRAYKNREVCPLGTLHVMGENTHTAGIASVIKVALMLSHKIIPPSRDGEGLRKECEGSSLYPTTQIRPWIHDRSLPPRRAAVNAVEGKGTATHLILEELRDKEAVRHPITHGLTQETELIVLTARSRSELTMKINTLKTLIEHHHSALPLIDIAYTLSLNFVDHHDYRLALVCRDLNQLHQYLTRCAHHLQADTPPMDQDEDIYYTPHALSPPGKIAFLFPGLGFPGLIGSYCDHLQELCLHFPEVREVFDQVDLRNRDPEDPLTTSQLFFPDASVPADERQRLRQRFDSSKFSTGTPDSSERNLASFGVAVANWVSWTILHALKVPVDIIFGQSIGELSALCAAGVVNFDKFITIYWQVLNDISRFNGNGRLAVVSTSAEVITPLLQRFEDVFISIYFRPEVSIIGGDPTQLTLMLQLLNDQGVWTHLLPYPAVHTPHFSKFRPILEPFLEGIALTPARVPVYSAITCDVYPKDERAMTQLMLDNLDHPVQLWQTYQKIYQDGARIFIQAGGGATMHDQTKTICERDDVIAVSLDVDYRTSLTQLNHLCATLLTNGVAVNLEYLYRYRSPHTCPLDVSLSPPAHCTDTFSDESHTPGLKETPPSESTAEHGLPFIGKILHYQWEREIVVERTLDLTYDLYLLDHLFIHAPGIKPPSALFPVLPLTISMEAMAEVATCLVPGCGVIGFEEVKASRWIALDNVEKMDLRITAQVRDYHPDTTTYRITAAIFVESESSPAISATVVCGQHYLQSLEMSFTQFTAIRPCPFTLEGIYRERRLFHGPLFQCIVGEVVIGDQGLTSELMVLPKNHLFRSMHAPTLLIDPIVLDGAGQLVGLWAQVYGRYVLPVRIEKLELYSPTPPVGTRMPVRLQITHTDSKTIYADIEVQDGTGQVWTRIKGWGDWNFRWTKKVYDFRRIPTHYVITHDCALPHLPEGSVAQVIFQDDLRDFELGIGLAAGFYLHTDEMPTFRRLATTPEQQLQWLLGRMVAKEAVRLWLAQQQGTQEMLHPASVVIEDDLQGHPSVRSITGCSTLPQLSIAHANDRAIAIASPTAIRIDLKTAFIER